ncbi:unnamed protein product [Ceratitis capitata]|uniref:(Mediterranean fruit fly) hypothetical protein n=1 Tax=Ceratitis capitata TaxID=7213 RepID=A0A811UP40_CERCA|nr:unnamed protein product [Ceratitis capitata]
MVQLGMRIKPPFRKRTLQTQRKPKKRKAKTEPGIALSNVVELKSSSEVQDEPKTFCIKLEIKVTHYRFIGNTEEDSVAETDSSECAERNR